MSGIKTGNGLKFKGDAIHLSNLDELLGEKNLILVERYIKNNEPMVSATIVGMNGVRPEDAHVSIQQKIEPLLIEFEIETYLKKQKQWPKEELGAVRRHIKEHSDRFHPHTELRAAIHSGNKLYIHSDGKNPETGDMMYGGILMEKEIRERDNATLAKVNKCELLGDVLDSIQEQMFIAKAIATAKTDAEENKKYRKELRKELALVAIRARAASTNSGYGPMATDDEIGVTT